MRILLIEPYDDLSKIIGLWLENLGHEFDLVSDATPGGGSLAEGRYGCVLINVDFGGVIVLGGLAYPVLPMLSPLVSPAEPFRCRIQQS
jgi:hypothetical protein